MKKCIKTRIRECFESIPTQLAKENKKFQYSVVRKGGRSLQKDSGLELDFLVRYKGECVVLEVKAKSGKAKSLKTALKNKNVYHLNNAIKLGQYNVGRNEEVLTIPLYMGFLIKDKLTEVIVPDIDLTLLN